MLNENVRMIVSFIIVGIIAIGIYAYSQRDYRTASESQMTDRELCEQRYSTWPMKDVPAFCIQYFK